MYLFLITLKVRFFVTEAETFFGKHAPCLASSHCLEVGPASQPPLPNSRNPVLRQQNVPGIKSAGSKIFRFCVTKTGPNSVLRESHHFVR